MGEQLSGEPVPEVIRPEEFDVRFVFMVEPVVDEKTRENDRTGKYNPFEIIGDGENVIKYIEKNPDIPEIEISEKIRSSAIVDGKDNVFYSKPINRFRFYPNGVIRDDGRFIQNTAGERKPFVKGEDSNSLGEILKHLREKQRLRLLGVRS